MPTLVVTGGSTGIGAAISRMAATRGWAVCLSYGTGAAAAQAVAREITGAGGQAIAVQADAADADATANLFRQAATLGPVTGVVANAGITGPMAGLGTLDPAALDPVLGVNVRGAYLTLAESARVMTKGCIVLISSRAAALGGAGEWVHYAASKGAVDTMAIGAAKELAPRGIRVNAVSPGLIDTPIHEKAGQHDRVARLAPSVPLGRVGTADDVARAVLWLLSDDAAYVTGANLPVSGGR